MRSLGEPSPIPIFLAPSQLLDNPPGLVKPAAWLYKAALKQACPSTPLSEPLALCRHLKSSLGKTS